MKHLRWFSALLLFLGWVFPNASSGAAPDERPSAPGTFAGWSTNGPGVYRLVFGETQTQPGPGVSFLTPPDLPPEIRRAMLTFLVAGNVTSVAQTQSVFDHFLPESLNHTVWTNVITHTNGRSTVVWSQRTHPAAWPRQAPVVTWNTNCLIWGMKGITALSPCWEQEGNPGQVPITALTRRHGYTRGHDMGPDGFGAGLAGKRVWFLTVQNTLVLTRVRREVVRTSQASGRDYTILLFASDLPETIQPMRVVTPSKVFVPGQSKYYYFSDAPCPIFQTEQGGNVSANVPGFTLDIFKGGDSGSPNLLPLPGELVFWTGRSTSGASPEMQADMDQLCRLDGLDAAKYQLQWVDLSSYPTY